VFIVVKSPARSHPCTGGGFIHLLDGLEIPAQYPAMNTDEINDLLRTVAANAKRGEALLRDLDAYLKSEFPDDLVSNFSNAGGSHLIVFCHGTILLIRVEILAGEEAVTAYIKGYVQSHGAPITETLITQFEFDTLGNIFREKIRCKAETFPRVFLTTMFSTMCASGNAVTFRP
jgi:hypothetical protein